MVGDDSLRSKDEWVSRATHEREVEILRYEVARWRALSDTLQELVELNLRHEERMQRLGDGVAAAWFVCANGVAVSEPFDTRQKAEGELSSRAKFYNDLYAEPCYVAGAYIAAQRKEGV